MIILTLMNINDQVSFKILIIDVNEAVCIVSIIYVLIKYVIDHQRFKTSSFGPLEPEFLVILRLLSYYHTPAFRYEPKYGSIL